MRYDKGLKTSPNEKPKSLSKTEKPNQGVFTDRELGRSATVIAQFESQQSSNYLTLDWRARTKWLRIQK